MFSTLELTIWRAFLYGFHQHSLIVQRVGLDSSQLWELNSIHLNKEIPNIILACFSANRNPLLWSFEGSYGLYDYVLRFPEIEIQNITVNNFHRSLKLHLDLILCQDNTTHFFPKGIWYFFLDPHFLCSSDSYICLQLGLRLTHCCHISKNNSFCLKT